MSLPIEILHIIFKQLPGNDIFRCRGVCRYWRDAVDDLSDHAWKEIFLRDKGKAKLDVQRARLSWRDMYKSISLWAHIKSADLTTKVLPANYVLQFKVLSNGVLSVLQNSNGDVLSRVRGFGDTIVYYDLDNYEEIGRECFDFLFSDYSENENYISAIDMDQRLCIVPKVNKKKFYVGKLMNILNNCRGVYTPCHKEIYFKDVRDMICISRLIEENGDMIVKTEELEIFEWNILAFSVGLENDFYIFTIEKNIYRYHNKDFEMIKTLNYSREHFYNELGVFGFDWSAPTILSWIYHTNMDILGEGPRTYITACCRHANIVIKGTDDRLIKIYHNPYKVNGTLKLRLKPSRCIDMTIHPVTSPDRVTSANIHQLFVVEKVNGHKLIVLTAHKVYVLDFDYNEIIKVKVNRKRAHSKCKRKGKKSKPKNQPKPKRRYNTRSSSRM